MSIVLDSKERIARSNIYSIFGKLLRGCTRNIDDGEVILYEAGLSTFVDEYSFRLDPKRINRGYFNDNEQYNPEYVCLSICQAIESSEEALLRFLNTIFKHTKLIEEAELSRLENYLGIIGYEIKVSEKVEEYWTDYEYSLVPSSDGNTARTSDMSYLRTMIATHHSDLLHLYDEATTNFGNAQYVSCIDNCRSLFEGFFKKLDPVNNDYVRGILAATGESVVENGATLTSIKKIYTYWINNKSGANRFRLFQTMYSAMSGLGTHHEDTPTREDALLLFRFVEDTLLWCFRKGIGC
jgi:hypothetical protein